VQSAVEAALHALGDGNWKMGEGIQVGRGSKEDDDGSILEHFLCAFCNRKVTSIDTELSV
jgi:exocyst complex protein 7